MTSHSGSYMMMAQKFAAECNCYHLPSNLMDSCRMQGMMWLLCCNWNHLMTIQLGSYNCRVPGSKCDYSLSR